MQKRNNGIPNKVFEDLLFHRRLERDLDNKLERLNRLLKEQIASIEKRRGSPCKSEEPNAREEAAGSELTPSIGITQSVD